jgi:predicted nuclease of predicted toxin-antitoxin system
VTFWIDAQLSPAPAPWLTQRFGVSAFSVKFSGFRDATDYIIFAAARDARAVVISKDSDFVTLLERYGPPPQVLWITAGNTSNTRMKTLFEATFSSAQELLRAGETLVEIGDL